MKHVGIVWKICICAVALTGIGLICTSFYYSDLGSRWEFIHSRTKRQGKDRSANDFWKSANMQRLEIDQNIVDSAKNVKIEQSTLQLPEGASVYCQYAKASPEQEKNKFFVLLLHGASFTSQNWVDIGTLQLISAMGYTAAAVDIPGFGKSSGSVGNRANFISSVVAALAREQVLPSSNTPKPVVVSPSMSGGYSIPALQAESARTVAGEPLTLAAFVAVAPVSTEQLTEQHAQALQTPTLILHGSRDTGLGVSSVRNLQGIPTSQVVEIPDAGHAAYMNQPKFFHKLVFNFLTYLAEKQAQ